MSSDSVPLLSAQSTHGEPITVGQDAVHTIDSITKQQIADQAPNGKDHPSRRKTSKSLKLISVGFKEAALDSPTFRAYVNYSFNRVEEFQTWLEALLSHRRTYWGQYETFDRNLNSLKDLFESPSLIDGLMDSDYTVQDIQFTSAGFKEIANEFRKFTKVNDSIEEFTNVLIQNDLMKFMTTRRKFETIQNKYDLVLSKFSLLSKTRDPVSLREDAFQLAEIRNQYIEISLDIAAEINDFTQAANTFMIELVTSLWRSNLDIKVQTKNFSSFSKYVERIYEFQKVSAASIETLRKYMVASKEQTVETTIRQFAPSKDLNDHNSALISPSTMLDGFDDPAEEKHGWLFVKTRIGKPSRFVWVRRWCFLKDGIFGMFSLDPTKTFVQELDKIGVALCNIRYCPEEDRRFCFEFKTINNTVIFQAETLHQLKSWLKVFQISKLKVIETNDSVGFDRYPPALRDFACTANTSTDIEMTTTGDVPSINELVDNNTFTVDVGCLSTLYNAPICTALSKDAVAAYSLVSPTSIPTAVAANIWGSVNWGSYYLLDRRPKKRNEDEEQTKTQKVMSNGSFISRYPVSYPKRLITFDAQLKSLLGPLIYPEEFVLLEFRSIWLPNARQEMVGRCYVTQKCVYFYMNSLGFVNLLARPLVEIISIDTVSEDNFDILKIYEVSGLSMKAKLYTDSGKLIRDQLNLLLKEQKSETPKSLSALSKELENLRAAHTKQEIERLRVNYETKKEIIPSVISTSLKMEQPMEIKTNYNQEMKLVWDKVYDIPSKALFHCLLGDESFTLQKILPYIDARNENISMTLWNQGEKQQLVRSFMTDTIMDDYEFRTTRIMQTIESIVNSKYYNVVQKTQYFKIPAMSAYRVITRVVIYSLNAKNSKLLIYSKIEFKPERVFHLAGLDFVNAHFLNKVIRLKVETLDSHIKEAIERVGTHAKVVKAIRLYGQITKTETPVEVPENDQVTVLSIYAFIKVAMRKLFENVFGVFFYFFRLIWRLLASLRTNYILVLLLGLSVGYNLLLMGKSGLSYWVVSRADNMINEYTSGNVMQRAIYLKDIEELIQFRPRDSNSRCFDAFKENSALLNLNSSLENDLKRTFRDLGLKRNKLLTNLKMINTLEEHLIEVEWNNFLSNEIYRCQLISELPIEDQNLDGLHEYCTSCQNEAEQSSRGCGPQIFLDSGARPLI